MDTSRLRLTKTDLGMSLNGVITFRGQRQNNDDWWWRRGWEGVTRRNENRKWLINAKWVLTKWLRLIKKINLSAKLYFDYFWLQNHIGGRRKFWRLNNDDKSFWGHHWWTSPAECVSLSKAYALVSWVAIFSQLFWPTSAVKHNLSLSTLING